MTPSEDLFTLIKSLSKAEKIYFKKFSSLHEMKDGNNYNRLFDVIDSMNIYDEKVIRKKFKGENFLNQLPVAKNYLYNSILRALRSFKRPVNKREEIRRNLIDISILFQKRLYGQCRKIITRSKQLAISHEWNIEHIQLLIWEFTLINAGQSYNEEINDVVNENYSERKKILNRLINLFDYDCLEYNFISKSMHSDKRDSKKTDIEIEVLLNSPLLNSESNAHSVIAKLKFNHVLSSYYYVQNDFSISLKFLNREIELLEKNPFILKERLRDYLVLINNKAGIEINMKKYKTFLETLEKLKSVSDMQTNFSDDQKYFIESRVAMLEMNYNFKIENINNCIKTGLEFLKSHTGVNPREKFSMLNLISHSYFKKKDFDKSLEFISAILNDNEASSKYINYHYARVFNLIVIFEIGNYDLLEYQVRSFYRSLLKKKDIRDFDKLLMSFFKTSVNVLNEAELKENLRELLWKLRRMKDKHQLENMRSYFDFENWIKNKIE